MNIQIYLADKVEYYLWVQDPDETLIVLRSKMNKKLL